MIGEKLEQRETKEGKNNVIITGKGELRKYRGVGVEEWF
jgi:hypothetical protein